MLLELKTLWENSFPLSSSNIQNSYYAAFAHKHSLSHFRVLKTSTVLKMGDSLPAHISRFIAEKGEVLALFEFFDLEKTKPVFVVLRNINPYEKEFLVWGHTSGLFYGFSSLQISSLSNPLVIVEGALDCEVCRAFYPNCLALLTASLSLSQVEFLKSVSNKVVLFYDNDATGHDSIAKDFSLLKKEDFDVSFFQLPKFKDAGDFAKFEWERKEDNADFIRRFLEKKLSFEQN